MSRMIESCTCIGSHMPQMPYGRAQHMATRLREAGWRQRKCQDCKRYTVWVRIGDPGRILTREEMETR